MRRVGLRIAFTHLAGEGTGTVSKPADLWNSREMALNMKDFFQDYWSFGEGLDVHLRVSYGDEGGVGFDGELGEAKISEHE